MPRATRSAAAVKEPKAQEEDEQTSKRTRNEKDDAGSKRRKGTRAAKKDAPETIEVQSDQGMEGQGPSNNETRETDVVEDTKQDTAQTQDEQIPTMQEPTADDKADTQQASAEIEKMADANISTAAAAKAAAAAAAQKLAQEIASSKSQAERKMIEHRVDVNDLRNKFLMTRRDSLKEIEDFAGVEAKSAGQFIPDRSIASENLPLHILIRAPNQQALDKAIVKIDELKHRDLGALVEDRTRKENQPKQIWPEEKVMIGFDNIAGRFNVKAKIIGPEGKFVKWISQEAGLSGRMPIKVQIKGRGSGYIDPDTGREADEPLYLSVTGPQVDLVQYAKELAEDLVAAVREKHAEIKQSSNPTASGQAYVSDFQGAFDANPVAAQYYGYGDGVQPQDPDALAAYYAAYYAQQGTQGQEAGASTEQADPAAIAAYQAQLAQYYAAQGYDQATIAAAMQTQQ